MLARLRDKVAKSPTLPVDPILARIEETTLADESVDLVFFGSVWHELDEPAMVLLEARRIMKIQGRLAILDWRADVAGPPGPPAWHRQKVTDVAATLARERWKVRITRNVGPYFYLVVADLK
jgi:ubiquinone/menaquinone biosynthesis C-methylase UbiE